MYHTRNELVYLIKLSEEPCGLPHKRTAIFSHHFHLQITHYHIFRFPTPLSPNNGLVENHITITISIDNHCNLISAVAAVSRQRLHLEVRLLWFSMATISIQEFYGQGRP